MEGATIGTYRLVHKLGEGGMGEVWMGEHTLIGRRAAIKLLLPSLSTNPGVVQRFFNEARAVTAIADPGIVQVFDFGVHADTQAFIVMELLDGESLDARVRRVGRLSPLDAARLVRQVASSLSAVHAKGVIHRDLKPENLFIVGDPAVTGGERTKILDFGIAKLGGDELSKFKTRTGVMMGTPVYMSPEQCRGMASIDHRTDLYSLGAVLFAMVCGRPPFDGEGSGDVIIAQVRDPAPVPSSLVPTIPPELDAVILRCLEKDPAHRFQSADELAAALAACLDQVEHHRGHHLHGQHHEPDRGHCIQPRLAGNQQRGRHQGALRGQRKVQPAQAAPGIAHQELHRRQRDEGHQRGQRRTVGRQCPLQADRRRSGRGGYRRRGRRVANG